MNINLQIERLILDGVCIPHAQRPLLQAAVEMELRRLLAVGGLAPSLVIGGAVPRVDGGSMQITDTNNYTQIGEQIAQTVYRGMGQWVSRQ
ncbi:hypothetical protein NIES4071_36850 [Calothrix sp. NIES-4071]|nr:hypothetical protein NIES4071_36850 [Calothrix sp. NIES-4071]BAZ58004.1 hypothetical protein NIES4105_36780 [Calothrix sp. NIES-4105]